MDGPRFAKKRGSAMIWWLTPGTGLIVALLLSLGLWGAIRLLAEDGAGSIIFYNRSRNARTPYQINLLGSSSGILPIKLPIAGLAAMLIHAGFPPAHPGLGPKNH